MRGGAHAHSDVYAAAIYVSSAVWQRADVAAQCMLCVCSQIPSYLCACTLVTVWHRRSVASRGTALL